MTSQLKSIAKGIFANSVTQAISSLQQLFLVPVFLTTLGSVRYGNWLVLYAAASQLSLCDFGAQNAAFNHITRQFVEEKYDDCNDVIQTCIVLYSTICVLGVLVVAGLVAMFPVARVLKLQGMDSRSVALAVILLAIHVLLSLTTGLLGGLYRCFNEYDFGQNIGNASRLLLLAIICVGLLTGGGVVTLALLHAIYSVMVFVFLWWHTGHRYPHVRLGVRRVSKSVGRSLLRDSSYFMLFPLGNLLTIQAPLLILSATLGSASLVAFSTTRTLANIIRQVVLATNMAVWPQATIAYVRKDWPFLVTLHRLTVRVNLCLAVTFAAFMWAYGGPFMSAWTRGKVALDPRLFGVFLFSAVMSAIWNSSGTFQTAFNQPRFTAIAWVSASITSAVLSFALIGRMSLLGIALACASGEILFYSLRIVNRTLSILGDGLGEFLKELFGRAGFFCLAAVTLAWLSFQLLGNSVRILPYALAMYSSFLAPVAWFALFTRSERERFVHFVALRLRFNS